MEKVTTTATEYGLRRRMLRLARLSTIVLFGVLTPLRLGAEGEQRVPSASESIADVTPLAADRTLVRDLSSGDEHRYAVALTADEYVDVRVDRRGVDVIVQARGMGDRLLDFQHDVAVRGEESIELVADGAGATYTLTLAAAPGTVARGSYAVRIASRRPATAADRAMQDARALCAAAAQRVDKDDLAGAVPLLERALTLADGARGARDPQIAFVTARLADVYLELRDAARAEPLFTRTLEIMDENPGRDHPSTGFVRARLARLYQQQGERLKAEALVKEALGVIERRVGPDHLLFVRSLMTLEVLRDDADDLQQAKEIVDRQLSILEKLHYTDTVLYAQVLSNLGSVYLGQDDPRAEDVLKRSLALSERLRGREAYAGTNQLVNLGIIARARKDYAAAEAYYQRAFAIRERMLGPDNPDLVLLLNNLANVYEDAGEPQRALENHFRALRIEENVLAPYHSMTLVTTSNIAGIYTAGGDVEKALAFRRRADAIAEQELALNLVVGSERQKLLFLRSMSERSDKTISLNLREAPASDDASALAALVILQRKGRVLDAMTDTFAVLRQRAADPVDRALLDRLNETTAQLAHVALGGSGAMARDRRRQAIKDLEAHKEQLEAELSERSAQLRAQIRPVTLEAVQAAIPGRAALLEFSVFHPWDPKAEDTGGRTTAHYAAYVIGRHGTPRGFDLGEAGRIDGLIDDLRGALRDPARGDVRRLARALDDRVMRPLRAALGDATQMLISPDGELNLVPFEALVDERGRYLIEGYDISYLTSGRDLLRMQVPRLPRSGPVIVADPLFGEPTTHAQSISHATPRPAPPDGLSQIYFAPLAGSAGEARAIKALFPEATLLSGARATKAAIQRADAPSLLHVASHAFFLPDADAGSAGIDVRNPLLRSGLALAGANSNGGPADAGILTALEASRLNLWGTKLVTLSACDTGVGDIHNGEGVYGLRRAFVLAGAETVVMTLWPVSDAIAREPMAAFYASLRAGDGRGDALRQAKLAMLKQKRRQHPFYWAGFILSGQWTALETP
jgi:CHAT domain-containing protein